MTHPGVFGYPFMYWVGMDTDPRTTPEALVEFNQFYSTIHVHEVLAAHPGFQRASRYELINPDSNAGAQHGPRWLASYEMTDEAAAEQYVKDNARPWLHRRQYSPWPPARKRAKTVWRLIWRQISIAGSTDHAPSSIYMVGMNVPPDTDAAGLEAFNAFYTETHVPEVMAAGGYTRATRHELYREFAYPAPGCPRFCAIYESDVAASEAPASGRIRGRTLSSGPPVWENHDTLWRLEYRLIPPLQAEGPK